MEWGFVGDLRAKAVFSIRNKIVCDRISSAQFFGVKTNVLCALKKLYSLVSIMKYNTICFKVSL